MSISHATDGCPGDDHDVTVCYAYDADGHLAALSAVNPTTGDQTTRYQYGTSLGDSGLASRELLRSVVYPDSAGGDDRVTYAYNRQGQVTRLTDQNGTVHDYAYDRLGRPTADAASALGPGIDGAVRRLGREYDPLGRVLRVTSYSAASGGSVVNQVEWAYNGLGQPTAESQAHGGSVNQATTPRVQTAYADASQNTARPTGVTYPGGRVVSFQYGAAGSDGDRLSRVVGLDDAGPAPRVEYSYLGLGTIVRAQLPEPQVRWDLAAGGTPTNPYPGLDRFGRVVANRWQRYAGTPVDVDRIDYGYDRLGNRLWRKNVAAGTTPGFDELYQYDGLSRLTDLARGYFPTADRQKVTVLTLAETWQLDATGNWARYGQTNGVSSGQDLAQTRVSNRANEIVDVTETYGDAWATPEYDRAGNMTTIPLPASTSPINPYPAVYDAWNRLVSVPAYSQSYRYDALHRRITSGTGTSQRHYYYSASWQVLEERLGTNPDTAPAERQFVWGLRYLDDCVLRDRSPTNNGVLSERLYALQDANWNVTCLVDVAGTPVERYTYRAYGAPWFYSGTFVPRNFGGLYQWETLYAGYRFDLFTGLYQVRYRYLHPGLGCWLTRDPIVDTSLDEPSKYQYARSAPTLHTDQTGLIAGPIEQARRDDCFKAFSFPPVDANIADDLVRAAVEMGQKGEKADKKWSKRLRDTLKTSFSEELVQLLCCLMRTTQQNAVLDPCKCGGKDGPCYDPLEGNCPLLNPLCQECCDFHVCTMAIASAFEKTLTKKRSGETYRRDCYLKCGGG